MNKHSELLHDKTKTGFPEENILTEKKKTATIPVAEAAATLGVSCQTIRLLLQMQAVDWGIAYKLPHSRHYSYLIYAERFNAEIGIGGDANC